MSANKHRCSGKVWNGSWRTQCGKNAKYEHNGLYYCKSHHPPSVAERDAERTRLSELKWAAQCSANDKRAKEQAEQKRRADMYDDLLEALKDAIKREHNPFEPDNQSERYKRWSAIVAKATGEQP